MEDRNMKTGWIHAEENNTNVRFAPKTLVSEVLISENEYSKEQFAAVLDKTGYIVEAAECEPYEKKGFSLFNK